MSKLSDKGSTAAWRKLRQSIIQRDKCCQRCGTEERLSVDHIVPRTLGGDDNPSNLQVLCSSCNSSKGGRFFDRALKERVVSSCSIQVKAKSVPEVLDST